LRVRDAPIICIDQQQPQVAPRQAALPSLSRRGKDFLGVGGMGYTLQVALGAALNRRVGRVWCIEGDGSFLMHLGAAAVVGTLDDLPLTCVLLDNGAHASVGGHRTASHDLDYGALAQCLGFRTVRSIRKASQPPSVLQDLISSPSPGFLWAKISNEPDLLLPRPEASLVRRKKKVMQILSRRETV
jgi:phosphonopyruvate decarboxylase